MRPVSCAYAKTWKGSSAPARSSAEVLEASQIRTRTIQSPYGGRYSPDIGLVFGGVGHSGVLTRRTIPVAGHGLFDASAPTMIQESGSH
jgi:hypothetical protein